MKKVFVILIAALLIPSAALAKGKPSKPAPGTHGKAQVLYVLKGTLSAYSAYSSPNNGSITIVVSRANYHGKALKGQTLTFPLAAKSRITFVNGVSAITDGDRGLVKVRAPKRIAAADLAATLQAIPARQVVDQGASG